MSSKQKSILKQQKPKQMKKMTLKTLALAALMLFGLQSFAGSIDTVYALAGNKIALTALTGTTGTDTAIWHNATTGSVIIADPTAGIAFPNSATTNGVMHVDGTITGGIFAQGNTAADSTTIKQFTYSIFLKSAGGCISDDSSIIVVFLMPNLDIPVVNADPNALYCANSTVSVELNATMPTLTGLPSAVTTDDFKWYEGTSTTALTTGFSGTQNNTLTVTSPNTATSVTYKAETKYNLPGTHSLIVSLVNTVGNAFSGTAIVTAAAAPTAPNLNGTAIGSGF